MKKGGGSNGDDEEDDEEQSGVGASIYRPSVSSSIHVAHIGNSIQYYNDCPRLLEQMLRSTIASNLTAYNGLEESSIEDVLDILVEQDSCLKGGANLSSLWFDGNGMDKKFASRPASRTTTTQQSAPSSSPSSSSSSSFENKEEYDIGASTVRQLLLNKNGRLGTSNRKRKMKNRNTTTTTTTTTKTHKFWDYIVINDHTQWPVRTETKKQSISILLNEYVPTIIEGMHQSSSSSSAVSAVSASSSSSSSSKTDSTTTTLLFVQTPAYKVPGILNSHDLGTFQEYTQQLREGYQDYVTAVHNYVQENSKALPRDTELVPLLVPFGLAYQMIHDDEEQSRTPGTTTTTTTTMWQTRLYAQDEYHPSPHGTFLLACVLHCYVTKGRPFTIRTTNGDERYGYDPATWWTTARYMQPTTATTLTDDPHDTNNNNKDDESLPLPTIEEALYLNDIAYRVYCQQQ